MSRPPPGWAGKVPPPPPDARMPPQDDRPRLAGDRVPGTGDGTARDDRRIPSHDGREHDGGRDLTAEQRMPRDRGGRPERARTDPGPSTGGGPGLRPLDPPPFQPATVRRCIRTTVRIQGFDGPQEVLILTSVNTSVESILSVDQGAAAGGGGEGESCSESDFTDSFDTSSSDDNMSFDGNGDGGGTSDGSVLSALMDDGMEVDDNPPPAPQDNNSNNNNNNIEINVGGSNQGYRMKAFLKSKKPLRENHHGVYTTYIYYARVLQKADLNWIATNEEVAIKEVSWDTIRASRSRLNEDFLKEIVALQYISDWHGNDAGRRSIMDTHVLAADTIMSNETHLHIVMPFCRNGDLFQLVAEREEQRLTEKESRIWFQQVLKGLESLQLMQLCHKDLSPENFIILDETSLVIDFGMCLRIPYSPAGRHMITSRPACGKRPHVAPEIWQQRPFDGHAVDLWAAGTVLLFLLTGMRLENPFLAERILHHPGTDLGISFEAMELLRAMLRLDPSKRLSFEQVQNHRWVQPEFM